MTRATHLRLQALAAAAVALVAATQLTLVNESTTRVRGSLGPTPGPNSIGHVEGKRAYLDRIAGAEPEQPGAGLVSFTRFISAAEAKTVIGGMQATVVFFRLPQSEPEAAHLMTKPLDVAVAESAKVLGDQVRAEIVSIEAQLRDAQGPERATLEQSVAERRQTLEALAGDCPCVYAVAVQGTTLGDLKRLQDRKEILLVDVPEPARDDLAGWELTPILPG